MQPPGISERAPRSRPIGETRGSNPMERTVRVVLTQPHTLGVHMPVVDAQALKEPKGAVACSG